MNEIKNLTQYNSEMRRGLESKTRWVKDIDDRIVNVIDYGCADGALFVYLEDKYPGRFHFYGIDNNIDMINEAPKMIGENNFPSYFTSFHSFARSVGELRDSIIVMNSVIHEIFAYNSYEEAINDLKEVINYGADYITIRDMSLPIFNNGPHLYYAQLNSLFNLIKDTHREYYDEWVNFSGSRPQTTDTCYEFLMKFQYTENWARERDEKYFWDWLSALYVSNIDEDYDLEINETFGIPEQQKTWYELFGIPFNVQTHRYCIFKKIGRLNFS